MKNPKVFMVIIVEQQKIIYIFVYSKKGKNFFFNLYYVYY